MADEVIPLFEDAATTEYASSAYMQTVLIYIATTPKYPIITGFATVSLFKRRVSEKNLAADYPASFLYIAHVATMPTYGTLIHSCLCDLYKVFCGSPIGSSVALL